MAKYWFFTHKESNRYFYEANNKIIISDKVSKGVKGNNIDPYIFSPHFLLSFCKQNQFNKFSVGDIIFFIIPEPITKNYLKDPSKKELKEGYLKRKDFKNKYLYCDLVFTVKDIKKYDEVKKSDFYNSNIREFHYERGKAQHGECKDITLISTKDDSYQPQENNFLIDILNLVENSSEDKIKEEIQIINTVDEVEEGYKGIRTLGSNALRIFEVSSDLGKFLIDEFKSENVTRQYFDDDDFEELNNGKILTNMYP